MIFIRDQKSVTDFIFRDKNYDAEHKKISPDRRDFLFNFHLKHPE